MTRTMSGNWVTFEYKGAPYMSKAFKSGNRNCVRVNGALVFATECSVTTIHETQGQALQALNKAKAAKAEQTSKTSKTSKKQTKDSKTSNKKQTSKKQTSKQDAKSERDAHNAAILATVPKARRAKVETMLNNVHKAGFSMARLAVNKNHQLDALRIYCGEAGKGQSEAFKACMTKRAAQYLEKRETAKRNGKPAPKAPACCFYWTPTHGGQLYARGVFGDIQD